MRQICNNFTGELFYSLFTAHHLDLFSVLPAGTVVIERPQWFLESCNAFLHLVENTAPFRCTLDSIYKFGQDFNKCSIFGHEINLFFILLRYSSTEQIIESLYKLVKILYSLNLCRSLFVIFDKLREQVLML